MKKYYRTNYYSLIQQFFVIDSNGWLLEVSHGIAECDEDGDTESIYGIDLLRITSEEFEKCIQAYYYEKRRRNK